MIFKKTSHTKLQKLEINKLLQVTKRELKLQLLKLKISLEGYDISIITSQTGNGGYRYWFQCPNCMKRSGFLYQLPYNNQVICRSCLASKY